VVSGGAGVVGNGIVDVRFTHTQGTHGATEADQLKKRLSG